MEEKCEKFAMLVDQRDQKLELHFHGGIVAFQESLIERQWYIENISPLDHEIKALANDILAELNLRERVKNIQCIYASDTLYNIYQKYSRQYAEERE